MDRSRHWLQWRLLGHLTFDGVENHGVGASSGSNLTYDATSDGVIDEDVASVETGSEHAGFGLSVGVDDGAEDDSGGPVRKRDCVADAHDVVAAEEAYVGSGFTDEQGWWKKEGPQSVSTQGPMNCGGRFDAGLVFFQPIIDMLPRAQ